METYIQQRHNTVAQYITTRLILDLCKVAERKRGTQEGTRWWEQAVLELAGAKETAVAAVEVDKDEMEE